jgi:transcription-repair coupling factor (superfamily II helicase)
MEIRGAGELLGEEQSGQIQQIGFSLYSELLHRAVSALREGREPELEGGMHQGPDIELHLPALIPEDYLHDVHARLTLYKRVAGASDPGELRELQVEMIDRFGLLPPAARNLFAVAELKLQAEALGITRLELGRDGGRVEFAEDAAADVEALLELIRSRPDRYRLGGPGRLQVAGDFEEDAARIEEARSLLGRLAA